jgi:DNA adenine methylase
MRPLISYYGGKQRLASKLVPLIPRHTVYCEPFAGGAALLFAKPWPAVSNIDLYREVINDTCGDLVNLYRVAQEHPDELAHRLQTTPYSEAEHARSAAILKREIPATDLMRAWAYYVKVQTSFANVPHGGWGRGVFGKNSAATWHKRDVWAPLERLRSVHICQTDALKCIKQWDSPQTFFYCDPPYPGSDQGDYKGYTVTDFLALVAALDACQGAVMLSCYDAPYLPTLPSPWRKSLFKTIMRASPAGKVGANKSRAPTRDELGKTARVEAIYNRPARGVLRSEIVKLYATGAYNCFKGDAPTLFGDCVSRR